MVRATRSPKLLLSKCSLPRILSPSTKLIHKKHFSSLQRRLTSCSKTRSKPHHLFGRPLNRIITAD
jgi:hypothetical protein